jgi:midasin (ATPase involved in ribosome maturation)
MSGTVTIDSLLGEVKFMNNADGETLTPQKQPFTIAFEQGHWLLLDEMNLVSYYLVLNMQYSALTYT